MKLFISCIRLLLANFAKIFKSADRQTIEGPARHFFLRHSVLRYHIQLLSLCNFVDCGFRVRVSSRIRVSLVLFFSCFFLSHVG